MTRAALVALALSAAFWTLSLDLFYPGRFTDDARHLNAAESLRSGHYDDVALAGAPPILNQLPGYPLLLVPTFGSVRAAQALNLLFLLGAGLVLLRLFKNEGEAGSWCVVLTLLSPLALVSSVTVMTEAPYLFFSSFGFLLLKESLESSSPFLLRHLRLPVAVLPIVFGFLVWIHPQGVAALLTLSILLIERRRPHFIRTLAIAFSVAALPFIFNAVRSGVAASYFSEAASASTLSVFASNVVRWPLLLAETMFHWIAPIPGAGSGAAWVLALAALALVVLELSRRKTALDRIGFVYLVLFVGLHLFWANQLHRYAFPLLPFLFLFLLRPFFRAGTLGRRFALFVAGTFVFLDVTLAANAHTARPGENVPPPAYAWVRGRTELPSVVASARPETVYLLTGRKGVRFPHGEDPDAWFGALVDRGVTYALAEHAEKDLPEAAEARRGPLEEALLGTARRLADPARFEPLFADDQDLTVFRLTGADDFRKARENLEKARAALETGGPAAALPYLLMPPAQEATLKRLPFFRGTTFMLAGKKAEARKDLEEAVRREPGFKAAQANLARVR